MDTEVIEDSENMSSTLKNAFHSKKFSQEKLKTEKIFLDVSTWKEMEERIHPKRRVLVSNLIHDREAVMLYSPTGVGKTWPFGNLSNCSRERFIRIAGLAE